MKFTIGIPAYKAAFLKECIDSILSQTYNDFELIIVNDASPENIDAIVNSYDSSIIQYYKNERNFGAIDVVDNWNKCLSYARGDFFILMGDDDKMAPDYLLEFSDLIDRYPDCGVYHCRTMIIDQHSNPIQFTEPRPEFESVYDSILQRIKGNRLFFISDYVYRTKKLRENGGFYKLPLAWASDDISSYIGAMDNGIAHTDKPVFMYRRSSQTISSSGSIYLKMDAILAEESWLNEFVLKEPRNDVEALLRDNIRSEIRKFVQKKKISTLYMSGSYNLRAFFKWLSYKKSYGLSVEELLYALLLSLREKRKAQYE